MVGVVAKEILSQAARIVAFEHPLFWFKIIVLSIIIITKLYFRGVSEGWQYCIVDEGTVEYDGCWPRIGLKAPGGVCDFIVQLNTVAGGQRGRQCIYIVSELVKSLLYD